MFKYTILFFIFFSCSANYHLNKAIKKGAKLETIETVKHDTTWITKDNYHVDTILDKQTIVKYVPETRWKTRIETKYKYKTNKEELRHIERVYRDSLNLEKRKLSVEKNKNNRFNRIINKVVFVLVLILIVYICLKFAVHRLLK